MVQQARGRQSLYRATARGSRVLCACAARAVCFDACCACTRRASRSAGMSCLAPFCVRKFPQGKQAACLECTRTLTPGGLVVGRRAASDQEYSEYVHLECSYNPTAVQNAVVRAVMGISESFDIVTIEAGLGAFEKGRIYQHFNDPKTHTEDPSFLLGVRPCGSSQYTKQAFRIEYKGASAAIVQCGVCSAPISEDFDVRVGARVGDFDHYFHWCHLRCWKVPFELTGMVARSFQRLQQDREFGAAVAIDDRLMNMDAGRVYAHLMTSSNHLPAPPPEPPSALFAVEPRLVVLPARVRVAPALVARADAVGTFSPTMTSGNHLPAPPMVDVQAIETDAVSESLGDIPEVVQGADDGEGVASAEAALEDAFEGPMGSDDVDQVNEAASDCTVADAEPDAYSDVVDATTPDPADTESCVMDRIESAHDLDVGSTQVDASPLLPQFDMQVLPSGGHAGRLSSAGGLSDPLAGRQRQSLNGRLVHATILRSYVLTDVVPSAHAPYSNNQKRRARVPTWHKHSIHVVQTIRLEWNIHRFCKCIRPTHSQRRQDAGAFCHSSARFMRHQPHHVRNYRFGHWANPRYNQSKRGQQPRRSYSHAGWTQRAGKRRPLSGRQTRTTDNALLGWLFCLQAGPQRAVRHVKHDASPRARGAARTSLFRCLIKMRACSVDELVVPINLLLVLRNLIEHPRPRPRLLLPPSPPPPPCLLPLTFGQT